MNHSKIRLTDTKEFEAAQVIELYKSNKWSSAEKPDLLLNALHNSHSLVLAYDDTKLVGLGNAISDGYLVVYYPHLLVHPDYQGKGIGRMIVAKLQDTYTGFHQQMLTADGKAIRFYEKCGFTRAGNTEPMWIYQGKEHS
ncbi:GNAT family N-acetyltransferase [Rapidithrix thailandica]|uniref:GNAT family N-acetyltransferase n=1 Tax=Rapidithrix thailandica TaxID=413964 RepID=A0AAW9S7D2_9BACT